MAGSAPGILPEKVETAMTKKYLVSLTDAERETLFTLTRKGSLAARKLTRAHILLQVKYSLLLTFATQCCAGGYPSFASQCDRSFVHNYPSDSN
jgi:hypothetical protein